MCQPNRHLSQMRIGPIRFLYGERRLAENIPIGGGAATPPTPLICHWRSNQSINQSKRISIAPYVASESESKVLMKFHKIMVLDSRSMYQALRTVLLLYVHQRKQRPNYKAMTQFRKNLTMIL